MKRGKIVRRRRFINKYGKSMLNGTLALAIMMCFATFIGTNTNILDKNIAHATTPTTGVKIVGISNYTSNQIVTEDGTRYYFEGVNDIIDENSDENVSYKAIIVNNQCTSILVDTTNE